MSAFRGSTSSAPCPDPAERARPLRGTTTYNIDAVDAGSLEPSDRLLHHLIDGGPQITIVIDALGQVTYSSANISTLFGFTPDEVLGTNILDYLDPDFSADSMRSRSVRR